MSNYWLTFKLKSDAAFGRGEGVAGLLDQEVQHDDFGCPYLGGRAIKGILVNECADILAALPRPLYERWGKIAHLLFGWPGSDQQAGARLRIGDATLPTPLHGAIVDALQTPGATFSRTDVLTSLTTVRRQTAMDETGVPDEATLRTIRLIVRETPFAASLVLMDQSLSAAETEDCLTLFAACVKAFRRVGTGRNRGHGLLYQVELRDHTQTLLTDRYFDRFCQEVLQ
ncbi:MAG: RAMP superfamily protein [Chloroflexi bacterium]|nr:MAG: RAMP superfamily protein [Chloroflexota bacterium]